MTSITVTTSGNHVYLISPYNTKAVSAAKRLGGQWDGARKAWRFDARDEDRVREMARDIYGTDGTVESVLDTVTVRIKAADYIDHTGRDTENTVRVAGRRVAYREYRDAEVTLVPGVVIVAGGFATSGGSMRYPEIGATDAVLEIRDVSRSTLDRLDAYELIDAGVVNEEALRAERGRLAARIAEIDMILGADSMEG